MTIITKFSIGDPLWFMDENKPKKLFADQVSIVIKSDLTTEITYTCGDKATNSSGFKVRESLSFSSKEALLQSL